MPAFPWYHHFQLHQKRTVGIRKQKLLLIKQDDMSLVVTESLVPKALATLAQLYNLVDWLKVCNSSS